MIGLNKIIEKIIEEAKVESREITEDANVKCIAISNGYAEKAEQIKKELRDAADKEAENIVYRAKSSAETEKRRIIQNAKIAMIDEAFAAAEKEIKNLSTEKYREMLVMLVTSAFLGQLENDRRNRKLYGDDEFEKVEKYEVVLNRNDRDIHGEKLLDGVRRAVVGKVDGKTLEMLVISDKVANIDGGVILKFGDVEINCSLGVIFAAVREKLEARVESILFENE